MSRIRYVTVFLSVSMLGIMIFGPGCSDSTEPNEPSGSLIDASDCKLFLKTDDLPQDCIAYDYDGQGTLTIRHLNTAFNCCPEYSATVSIQGSTVTVAEVETMGMCDCTCLFDLEFRVTSLPSGQYRLSVSQEYLGPDDPVHTLVLDLGGAVNDEQCFTRDRYPWNVPPID